MTARPAADQGLGRTVLVSVRFTRPREFVAELQARGPAPEPLVRLTHLLRPRRLGRRLLSSQELVVHASYLRRTDTIVHLVTLECLAGIWQGVPELDVQTEQQATQVRELVRATAAAAGLETAPGRYATPTGR